MPRRPPFGGGTLQCSRASQRAAVTLNAAGGTIDTNSNASPCRRASPVRRSDQVGAARSPAANTYTGGTLVNAGMLQLGAGASLAAAGALTVNGGVFNLNSNNQTVAPCRAPAAPSCWAAAP